jgi:hypothetical protein
MSTLQEQYVTLVRQGQEATLAVVDAWTTPFQDAAVKLPHTAQTASREAVSTRSSTWPSG